MAESLFILELEFLHIRGGCSLIIVFFVLMLVGTCCFFLCASLCVVRPTYRSAHRHENVLFVFSLSHYSTLQRAVKRISTRVVLLGDTVQLYVS